MPGTGDTTRGAASADGAALADGAAWAEPDADDAWAPADDGGAAWSTDAPEPTAWAGDPGQSVGESPGAGSSVWDDDAPPPASAWDDAPGLSAGRDGATWTEPDRSAGRTARRPARAAARPVARAATRPAARAAARPVAPAMARPAVEVDASPLGAADDPGVPRLERDERRRVADELRRRLAGSPAAGPGEASAPVLEAGTSPDLDAPVDVGTPDQDHAPAPARGRGARSGGWGRSGGGGRGRAPATDPPATGSAAVDAEPDPEQVARSVALRLLTGAPRSRAQLAEAMARRDVPEDVADRVLDRFTEVGLVDDAAYAEILVRSRHAERGLSRRALSLELRRRGVDDETAREALAQVDDDDEEQAARALARKKLASTRGLDREVRLRRAYGALGRKGYGGSLVSRVVREELAAEGRDEDPGDTWPGSHGDD